jgi:hypothetical protein
MIPGAQNAPLHAPTLINLSKGIAAAHIAAHRQVSLSRRFSHANLTVETFCVKKKNQL